MKKLLLATIIAVVLPAYAQDNSTERSIYLNGIDISSARNQKLKKVDIHVDENGNVFITAPHYDVLEEGSYVPLSKWSRGNNTEKLHKAPKAIAKGIPIPHQVMDSEKTIENPASEVENVPVEKAGTEWPDANSE
jgi:hypothetical protein